MHRQQTNNRPTDWKMTTTTAEAVAAIDDRRRETYRDWKDGHDSGESQNKV
jgi:hypothetical protein